MVSDLSDRLFKFAVRAINLLKALPDSPENNIIRYQLTKCATSSGANYDEAQAGSSRADFTNKVRIALREMREANYWLRLMKATIIIVDKTELEALINESHELKLILGSIAQKTRK